MTSRLESGLRTPILAALALTALLGPGAAPARAESVAPTAAPTAAEAGRFIADAEARLLKLWVARDRAQWVQATYITGDTETLAAQANEAVIAATMELARAATRFDALQLPRRSAPEARPAQDLARAARALRRGRTRGADPARGRARGDVRARQVLPAGGRRLPRSRTALEHPRASRGTRSSSRWPGTAGTRSRARCARSTSASSSWATRAPASSASPTSARSGAPSTTCRRTPSWPSSTASGTRSSRSTTSSTATCAPG